MVLSSLALGAFVRTTQDLRVPRNNPHATHMEYRFSPEQDELRDTVRRLLAEHAHPRNAYDRTNPAADTTTMPV